MKKDKNLIASKPMLAAVPSHDVWFGNGYFWGTGNRKLFSGTEDECKQLVSKIADKYREKKIQLHHQLESSFMISTNNRYLYAFVAAVEA